jgi:hypothetical protein
MNIQPNNNLSFNAKIIHNQSYEEVVKYALEHNKMTRLISTLNNIDKIRKDTFLEMNICYTGDYPSIVFSRYERGWNKVLQEETDDYVLKRQVDYISTKKENPVKYALSRLIKLGNDAPNNKMYQEVVIKKDESKKKYFLF